MIWQVRVTLDSIRNSCDVLLVFWNVFEHDSMFPNIYVYIYYSHNVHIVPLLTIPVENLLGLDKKQVKLVQMGRDEIFSGGAWPFSPQAVSRTCACYTSHHQLLHIWLCRIAATVGLPMWFHWTTFKSTTLYLPQTTFMPLLPAPSVITCPYFFLHLSYCHSVTLQFHILAVQ